MPVNAISDFLTSFTYTYMGVVLFNNFVLQDSKLNAFEIYSYDEGKFDLYVIFSFNFSLIILGKLILNF